MIDDDVGDRPPVRLSVPAMDCASCVDEVTAAVEAVEGVTATDTAIETADVALLGDDLRMLPYLVRLSRRATGVIRQNIAGSLGLKAVLALGVPFGLVGVVEAIDMWMSLGVTGNAMRLAGVAPEDP